MATLTYAYLLLGSPADRVFRDHWDAFETSDARFVAEYRLTKGVTHWLCDQLRGKLQRCREGPRVLTVEQQVLAALRFYAAGGFQGTVGSDENIGVLQCSFGYSHHSSGWTRATTRLSAKALIVPSRTSVLTQFSCPIPQPRLSSGGWFLSYNYAIKLCEGKPERNSAPLSSQFHCDREASESVVVRASILVPD
ncbi:hypothetical protein ISCGN_003318 [Ixodes scapularis]